MEKRCEICGVPLDKNRKHGALRFCSWDCYHEYQRLYRNDTEYGSKYTPELRDAIKERDRCICVLCNRLGCQTRKQAEQQGLAFLVTHHIDWDKANSVPENLITLCTKCHARVHTREEYREKVDPVLLEIAERRSNGSNFRY